MNLIEGSTGIVRRPAARSSGSNATGDMAFLSFPSAGLPDHGGAPGSNAS
jgi:hypothetical protein